MATVVRIDQSHSRSGRPALESANQSQFHEIAIPIDQLPPVPAARLTAKLGPWVRPFEIAKAPVTPDWQTFAPPVAEFCSAVDTCRTWQSKPPVEEPLTETTPLPKSGS